MKIIARFGFFLASACLLLAVPVTGGAYEVYVLRDEGSQWRNIERENYDEAIEILEERLDSKAKYRDIKLTNLCTAYILARKFERAEKVCDEAVKANGTFVTTAYNSRGVLRALRHDYLAAAADFDKAMKKHEYSMWTQFAHRDSIESNYKVAHDNLVALRAAEKEKEAVTAGVARVTRQQRN